VTGGLDFTRAKCRGFFLAAAGGNVTVSTMTAEERKSDPIEEAQRELDPANEQLDRPSITERDLILRNQAERRLRELKEGRNR
jgi:hypothetical protein